MKSLQAFMLAILVLVALILFLKITDSKPTTTEVTQIYASYEQKIQGELDNTTGITDCVSHVLMSVNIIIIRCPNSTTTTSYRAGKLPHQVTVTDTQDQLK